MPNAALRIISLIPSATEIVAALGLEGALVGRSHECDYPLTVQSLPICTVPNLDPQGTSREIHDRVEDLLQSALSIYRIDLDALEHLRPTHILTQAQCEVCAVSLAEVEAAVTVLARALSIPSKFWRKSFILNSTAVMKVEVGSVCKRRYRLQRAVLKVALLVEAAR
jgi:hypothetical protein